MQYKTFLTVAHGEIGCDETVTLRYDSQEEVNADAKRIFDVGIVKYAKVSKYYESRQYWDWSSRRTCWLVSLI